METTTTDLYADWLPLQVVQERTGMSERTIFRHVTAGKIRKAERPIPGRKPLPVYHPEDVATFQAGMVPRVIPPVKVPAAKSGSMAESTAAESGTMAELQRRPAKPQVPAALAGLAALLAGRQDLAAILPPPHSAILPPSELRHKRYLTTDEAVAYTGLTAEHLAKLARGGTIGRIETMRPFRYKRTDLDQL